MTNVSAEDLYAACDALWDTDSNRLKFGSDIVVHLAGLKRSIHDTTDRADQPFFTKIDPAALARPTYAAFIKLLDNYEPICGTAEVATSGEKAEEVAFIELIFPTAPIQFCFEFLKKHNKVQADPAQFKRLLGGLWFQQYRRTSGGPIDSSGFEHVFVGEVKNGEVSGCHSWVNIYLEEKKGTLNYKGFFLGRARNGRTPPADSPYLVSLQFSWHGVDKKIGSTMLGVSPEFEVALYTLCYMCGTESNLVELGDFQAVIVCHDYNHGRNIGTCYPEIPKN